MHCKLLSKYCTREGASKKSEWVSLTRDDMKTFDGIEAGMHDSTHLGIC